MKSSIVTLLLLLQLLTLVNAVLVTKNWNITEINTHYMGGKTGLPGNVWPESSKFASTIRLNIYRWFDTTEAHRTVPYVNLSSIPASYNIR